MSILDEPQDDSHRPSSCSSMLPPLSIKRLLALHPRERLLVHPLCWTDRQLTLLDCRIHSHSSTSENAEDGTPKSDGLARLLARRLNRQLGWERLADTIQKLLRPLGGSMSIKHRYVLYSWPLTRPFQPSPPALTQLE